MIESHLTHEMVIQGEPSLDKYIFENDLDWGEIIDESFKDMLKDLIDNGYVLRQLCKKLYLEGTTLTKTASYDGIISKRDYAQRLRFILPVTSITAGKTASFILWGTDNDGLYYDQIMTVVITQAGKYKELLPALYKMYKLELILNALEAPVTIVYGRPYLIETSFERLHLLKTRAKIYYSLKSAQGDMYEGKYNEYSELYKNALVNTRFYYDESDDEEVSISETEDDQREVVFRP